MSFFCPPTRIRSVSSGKPGNHTSFKNKHFFFYDSLQRTYIHILIFFLFSLSLSLSPSLSLFLSLYLSLSIYISFINLYIYPTPETAGWRNDDGGAGNDPGTGHRQDRLDHYNLHQPRETLEGRKLDKKAIKENSLKRNLCNGNFLKKIYYRVSQNHTDISQSDKQNGKPGYSNDLTLEREITGSFGWCAPQTGWGV